VERLLLGVEGRDEALHPGQEPGPGCRVVVDLREQDLLRREEVGAGVEGSVHRQP
jgi:hypothetical protein